MAGWILATVTLSPSTPVETCPENGHRKRRSLFAGVSATPLAGTPDRASSAILQASTGAYSLNLDYHRPIAEVMGWSLRFASEKSILRLRKFQGCSTPNCGPRPLTMAGMPESRRLLLSLPDELPFVLDPHRPGAIRRLH